MSRTYRSKPSSRAYIRRMRHIGSKRASVAHSDLAKESDILFDNYNRIISQLHNQPDPWDDFIISHYRGQAWNREIITNIKPKTALEKFRDFLTSFSTPHAV